MRIGDLTTRSGHVTLSSVFALAAVLRLDRRASGAVWQRADDLGLAITEIAACGYQPARRNG